MRIFYAWQADTPRRIGKALIRQALDAAVLDISETMNLDEAERPTVDQDTQGVMGSPPIAETIFRKIRTSDVVVVDVTLVGGTLQGKRLINSNVAYELGYAHGCHGDQVLIAVMNTHYGLPDELPFDMKHRRWPVQFEVGPEATRDRINRTRNVLARDLAEILRQYAEQASSTGRLPRVEVQAGKLLGKAGVERGAEGSKLVWRLDLSVYIEPTSSETIVFPSHKCEASVKTEQQEWIINKVSFPKHTKYKTETIFTTENEAVVRGAGRLEVLALQYFDDVPLSLGSWARARVVLRAAGISGEISLDRRFEYEGEGKFRLVQVDM